MTLEVAVTDLAIKFVNGSGTDSVPLNQVLGWNLLGIWQIG